MRYINGVICMLFGHKLRTVTYTHRWSNGKGGRFVPMRKARVVRYCTRCMQER